MKKLLTFITLLLALVACIVSCKPKDPSKARGEHTHEFGEWSVTKKPTGESDGQRTRYCSCGEEESEIIPRRYSDGLGFSLNSDELSYMVGGIGTCKDADVFIACTDSDELNIIACLTAKRVCDICTMCFVRKEGYKASLGIAKDAEFNGDFYIDNVIWPQELLTQEIFRIVTVAKALDVENFAGGRARLLEYKIPENSPLVMRLNTS